MMVLRGAAHAEVNECSRSNRHAPYTHVRRARVHARTYARTQATNDHYVIGLKILNQLVEEINIPTTGRTLPQHRKTAVSFRDLCLLPIFQASENGVVLCHAFAALAWCCAEGTESVLANVPNTS